MTPNHLRRESCVGAVSNDGCTRSLMDLPAMRSIVARRALTTCLIGAIVGVLS
jgi:hypothetical protein